MDNDSIKPKHNKKKLLHLIYGRTIFVALMVLLQLGVLISLFTFLQDFKAIYVFCIGVSLILTVGIINSKSNPVFKLAWIIPILVLPVFGGLFYLFFNLQSSPKKLERRMNKIFESTKCLMFEDKSAYDLLKQQDKQVSNLSRYIKNCGGYPVYTNTDAVYFPLGEDKFRQLVPMLEKAEKFIFLEYFIINTGEMWDTVLEILKRKVKEGVEVRVMYDGLCCLALLPFHYPAELEEYGIKCKMFSPIMPVLSSYQNNRDHRKILVIDGKAAFTGGVNLADEYINVRSRYGHWKDTAVMVEGDAVRSFTLMFLEMWNVTEKEQDDYESYLLPLQEVNEKSLDKGFVIPYADSPLDDFTVGKDVYLDIINTAQDYVHIMTPYLILDNETLCALNFAAQKGVDVKLIMPHIPDKPSAFAIARTYYPILISAGVKIYEYTPGFVHAKVFTSDDKKATVGTVNLDYRSLYLHFECGALFYDCPVIADVEKDFQQTLEKCHRFTLDDWKNLPFREKLKGFLLKFIAPLM